MNVPPVILMGSADARGAAPRLKSPMHTTSEVIRVMRRLLSAVSGHDPRGEANRMPVELLLCCDARLFSHVAFNYE